jgi:pyrroloquinoline quinone (PQQ) biosynthesis protein C
MRDDFFQRLDAEIGPSRMKLHTSRLGQSMLDGSIPLEAYKGYLRETYHFVRHTPRFLAAAASRFGYELESVRRRFLKHATEEFGHERFCLKDLQTLGVAAEETQQSQPLVATTALISFHYYMAERVNPVALFGTIYSLEGLGQDEGNVVYKRIQKALGLPNTAVTFLSSHAEFDVKHLEEARKTIVEHVHTEEDEKAIIYASKGAFELYAFMFEQIWERYEAMAHATALVG